MMHNKHTHAKDTVYMLSSLFQYLLNKIGALLGGTHL